MSDTPESAASSWRSFKLLEALAFAYSFPFGKELHLAHALGSHGDEAVRAWALSRIPTQDQLPIQRAPTSRNRRAWTHRFERHAFALADALVEDFGSLAEGLRRALSLASAVLRDLVWEGAASVLCMWRWRSRHSLAAACADGLDEVLINALITDVGEHVRSGSSRSWRRASRPSIW